MTRRDGQIDAVVAEALRRYHAQTAGMAEDGRAEVAAADRALGALATWLARQADQAHQALRRAEQQHDRQQGELEEADDEVAVTGDNLRNIQRGLENQVRGLFGRVSGRFNEIRHLDGGFGGEITFEVAAPSLDAPGPHADVEEVARRRWRLAATPRWARRPPEPGSRPHHVPYLEKANTAQYKLATVQLVLAALLADEDPIGRVLILDELGDGLGDDHRDRVLDALRRAAEETGITVLATVQDDLQHEAFERCAEVLLLRYPDPRELLNEPTRMFAADPHGDAPVALRPLADALRAERGPGWSALLAAYEAVEGALPPSGGTPGAGGNGHAGAGTVTGGAVAAGGEGHTGYGLSGGGAEAGGGSGIAGDGHAADGDGQHRDAG